MESLKKKVGAFAKKKEEELSPTYSPNNPPWNSFAAFLLWMASVSLIIIMPNIFLLLYVSNQGIEFSNQIEVAEFLKSEAAILIQVASVFPAHIITLILAWLVITKCNRYSFKEMLGWDWGGFSPKQASFVFFGLLLGVFVFIISAKSIFGEHDNEFLRILRSSRYAFFLVAFMATFSAPIIEEIVYRGVLFSALQRSLNVLAAFLLVTLVFAVVHFPQYWGDPVTISTLLFLSSILTLIRIWTKNLLPCIVFHFIFNGIQIVFHFIFNGIQSAHLILQLT